MITLVNDYTAILESCVLLPINLCDLLLRLAEEPALYRPRWSADILDEVERNLRGGRFQLSSAKASYRVACMRSAFPEAAVEGYHGLINAMPIHEKDRHVLAAAVVAQAGCIVTANLRHFPAEQALKFGIAVIHPDQFLIDLHGLDSQTVQRKVLEQAAAFERSRSAHLEVLAKSVPAFVGAVQRDK